MRESRKENQSHATFSLSTDAWAVIFSLVLAALVRFGVFERVPW